MMPLAEPRQVIAFVLDDMTNDLINNWHSKAAQKNICLNRDMSADLPTRVAGDARVLQELLTQLVGQAIRMTHEGNVSLSVLPAALDQDAGTAALRFEVVDTGIGVSQETVAAMMIAVAGDNAAAADDNETAAQTGAASTSTMMESPGQAELIAIARTAALAGIRLEAENNASRGKTIRFDMMFKLMPSQSSNQTVNPPERSDNG